MVGVARSASARPSSLSSSTVRPPPISARSRSCSTSCGTSNARPSRRRPRPPVSARRMKRSSNRSRRASRSGNSSNETPDPGAVRVPAAARLGHLRRALLPGSQPADQPGDELASRSHRRQADRGARGPDPAADHQPAAPPSQILAGLDRLSGLVSRPRRLGPDPLRQLCPGSRRQTCPRLPRHHEEPVVSADLFDPPGAAPPGRAGIHHHLPGYRLATSTGGVLTGRGADIILIDDPLKPEEALSDAQRQACNEWYDHTLYSRQNDKRHGAIVIIIQRLHEDDLVGHVLGQERSEILSFPAIAETDEEHRIEMILEPKCFRRRPGEALHPDREPLEVLDRIRRTIGEYNFAGQYQQSPAPLGGGLVKAEWFKRYRENERPERFDRIVQSWDTANKATELSDFSVCYLGREGQTSLPSRGVSPAPRIPSAE